MKKLAATLGRLALFVILCCLFSLSAFAGEVTNLRIGQGVGNVRVVFDATSDFHYNVFLLDTPKRLVIDVDGVSVSRSIENTKDKNNIVGKVRVGTLDGNRKRIVFDLQKPVTIKKVFMLSPQSNFNWRLAIDVNVASERDFASKVGMNHSISNGARPKTGKDNVPIKANNNENVKKVVVIDAGHGGHDPGAIGYSGVYEKTITLAVAKELKRLLDKEGKYNVFLTRSTDTFIPLRDRFQIARKHNADLFISLHADSATNRNAKGLSVYTLSETASDKEAAALAERENKVDIIAGINMFEQSKEVNDVLISLAQRETRNRCN